MNGTATIGMSYGLTMSSFMHVLFTTYFIAAGMGA